MSTNRPCDLKAAVGGDGDRVTHLEIVCIWGSQRYKRIPVYTLQAKLLSIGQGHNKCKTHILAIAVGAYRNVLKTNTNKSILITGEYG